VARPIIGALQPNAPRGESGLERFLDSLLAGVPGEATYLKDGRGRLYESPGRLVRLPVAGDDVVLTIDSELQSIAETALEEAFEEYHPDRGDIVFLDPRTGELLAAASRGIDSTGKTVRTASFFLNAFEPGSTAKPFTAAALLALKRVSATETVSPEAGKWVFPISATRTRTITDDHPQHAPITLAHAIQVSSNIGMAKFAQKLTREEHYDALHAFGFGSPTGIEFPVESPGVLQRPETWQPGQQGASMAMGYALQVTPIQLATAYGAIANDGVMMAPALIKEIRTSDGQVLYRHHPTAIRQVIPAEVAVQLRAFLANAASDSGTGKLAQVRYGVVGKTGTAKLTRTKLVRTKQGKMIRHSYYTNEHAASFAGIFPAKNPRLVVIVRIENPRGQYYGGFVAAPLVARMLRQALAARGSAINQVGLVDTLVRAAHDPTPPKEEREDEERDERQAIRFPLPSSAGSTSRPTEVPEVVGLSIRQAALALHRRGFRVRLEGSGRVVRSQPEAGDSLETGKTVTLYAETKPRS
jgi:cell division protein FtsI (penicillin-binding protein 3)